MPSSLTRTNAEPWGRADGLGKRGVPYVRDLLGALRFALGGVASLWRSARRTAIHAENHVRFAVRALREFARAGRPQFAALARVLRVQFEVALWRTLVPLTFGLLLSAAEYARRGWAAGRRQLGELREWSLRTHRAIRAEMANGRSRAEKAAEPGAIQDIGRLVRAGWIGSMWRRTKPRKSPGPATQAPRKRSPGRRWRQINRTPWVAIVGSLVIAAGAAYTMWTPGLDVRDGRHDRGRNGAKLSAAWLASDDWFKEQGRDIESRYRDTGLMLDTARLLRSHGVHEVYPELPPPMEEGLIRTPHASQLEAFLYAFADLRVLPRITGTFADFRCDDPRWRRIFTVNAVRFLENHPRLAGLQIAATGIPTGNADFLALLEEVKDALPEGRTLSVEASDAWSAEYLGEVSKRAPQLDLAAMPPAAFVAKLAEERWSQAAAGLLAANQSSAISFVVPASGSLPMEGWFRGMHRALASLGELPAAWQGIVIDGDSDPSAPQWECLRELFLKPAGK